MNLRGIYPTYHRSCFILLTALVIVLALYIFCLSSFSCPGPNENSRTFAPSNQRPCNSFCDKKFKDGHMAVLKLLPGRTGTIVFQSFCLLALSSRFCYTAILPPNIKHLDSIFDLKNVKRVQISTEGFLNVRNDLVHRRFNEQFMKPDTRYNWTLTNRCESRKYFSEYEDYIKSSITFKDLFLDEARSFMVQFRHHSTVCVHVRGTDKNRTTRPLNWYVPYIQRAITYLETRQRNLKYIFVSDDLQWCRSHFSNRNVHFSPGTSPGFDLALLTLCDYNILTVGTFGWIGAWLGKPRTVIYNNRYLQDIEYNHGDLFLPSWIGIK